jgi:5-methylcytosine-specific restriction endonuclease McrA
MTTGVNPFSDEPSQERPSAWQALTDVYWAEKALRATNLLRARRGQRPLSPKEEYEYVSRRRMRELKSLPYESYLHTVHWLNTASSARNRAGHKCERCGAVGSLEVHHLSYERIGEELPGDLEALCSSCHEDEHGLAPS